MTAPTAPEPRINCTEAELRAALGPANGNVAAYVMRALGQAGHVVRQLDHGDDQADTAPAELHTRTTGKRASKRTTGKGKA